MLRQSNKQKSGMGLAALLFAVCISVAGCGGNATRSGINTGVNRGVSDSAVSGGAVSDGTLQTAETEEKYRYRTDTNAYYLHLGDICQIRLDGTHKKKILSVGTRYMGQQLCGVRDGWLYFQEETPGALYRIPIKKDGGGYDVVKTSGQERVKALRDAITVLCLDEDSVFYEDENESTIFQYDWKKKKPVSKWSPDDIDFVTMTRLGGQYVVLNEDEGMFVREDGQEWRKISGEDTVATDFQLLQILYAQNDRKLYYVPCVPEGDAREGHSIGASVRVYDGTEEKDFVSEEQIVQEFRQGELQGEGEVTCCTISNLFLQDNRLYIQIQAEWRKGEQYHVQYAILSQGVEEGVLQYEKALSECMHSHAESRQGSIKEDADERTIIRHITANDAQCIGMAGGMAYISSLDYEKQKGRLGCYALEGGKFSWIDEEDTGFRKLCAQKGENSYDALNSSVFYDESANPFCGFQVYDVKGADGGTFYEEKK